MRNFKSIITLAITLFALQAQGETNSADSTKEFWKNEGFRSLTSEVLPARMPKENGLKIDAIVLKETAWTPAIVRTLIKKAQEYYWRNCKINLGPFEIFYGKNPDLKSINIGPVDKESEMVLKQYRIKPDFNSPTIYFIGQEEYVPGTTGRASMKILLEGEEREKLLKQANLNMDDDQPLSISTNTILMFEPAIEYSKIYKYNVFIHELAHVLTGEIDLYERKFKGNILSGNYDGMKIKPAQCDQIKSLWSLE